MQWPLIIQQGAGAKYGIILKTFFLVWIVQFLKKYDKTKFSWWGLLFQQFLIKIQPNMSEQEKKQQRIYDLLNAETKPKKISKTTGVSLWPLPIPDLNPLDCSQFTFIL